MKKERILQIKLGLADFKNFLEEVDYWCYEHIYAPIIRIHNIIEANIDLLYFFNKERLYFDWDYNYLLLLMSYKMKRMRKCLDRDNIIVKEELDDVLQSLDETREHIRRYIDYSEVFEEENPLPFRIGFRSEPTEDGKGSYLVSVNEDEGRDLTQGEEDLHLEWLKKMHEFEDKEWNAIWDTIKKHGRSWWD